MDMKYWNSYRCYVAAPIKDITVYCLLCCCCCTGFMFLYCIKVINPICQSISITGHTISYSYQPFSSNRPTAYGNTSHRYVERELEIGQFIQWRCCWSSTLEPWWIPLMCIQFTIHTGWVKQIFILCLMKVIPAERVVGVGPMLLWNIRWVEGGGHVAGCSVQYQYGIRGAYGIFYFCHPSSVKTVKAFCLPTDFNDAWSSTLQVAKQLKQSEWAGSEIFLQQIKLKYFYSLVTALKIIVGDETPYCQHLTSWRNVVIHSTACLLCTKINWLLFDTGQNQWCLDQNLGPELGFTWHTSLDFAVYSHGYISIRES